MRTKRKLCNPVAQNTMLQYDILYFTIFGTKRHDALYLCANLKIWSQFSVSDDVLASPHESLASNDRSGTDNATSTCGVKLTLNQSGSS